jgi:peptidyl-prolyl cis-trans isomerase B (cyclophilin B)
MRKHSTLTLGLVLLAGMLPGCGQDAAPEGAPAVQAPKLAVQGAAPAQTAKAAPAPAQAAPDARLLQSFQEATTMDVPEGQQLLDETKSRKSVGKLFVMTVAEWAKVPFTTPDGKKLAYAAMITTELGVVKIELWPEVAPNHVRSFVALARAGYFDGLEFDRAVRREAEERGGEPLEYVEAGCPAGTGEQCYGSIGYWLKPEFSTKVRHEAGTVGAWHGEEVETAACKFYINLGRAEWMDGNFTLFGKVSEGLDVVRAIHRRPVRDDGLDRPEIPVVMRSVTIECKVRD